MPALPSKFRFGDWRFLSRFILLAGASVQVVQYLFSRSLWADEARLALNVLDRSPLALLRPLDYNQGAPVLFLLIVKGITLLFGSSEYALRFFPLAASLAALLLFYRIAIISLEPFCVPIAVFLYSFSYPIVFYSEEFKQYSTDVASSLLLIYLALRVASGGERRRLWFAALAGFGAIAVFLSAPSVFTLAAAACILSAQAARQQLGVSWRQLAMALFVWLLCVAVNYHFFLASLTSNRVLNDYWQGGFLPLPSSLTAVRLWLHVGLAYFRYLGYQSYEPYVFGLLIACAACSRGLIRQPVVKTGVLVLAFTITAAALRLYPFSERLILFLAPTAMLLAVMGMERLYRTTGGLLFAFAGLVFVLPQLRTAHRLVYHRIDREEVRSILSDLDQNRRIGDPVYVYYGAAYMVRYYRRVPSPGDDLLFFGTESRSDRSRYLQDIASMRRYPRVWFLFSHSYEDEVPFILKNIKGRLLDEHHEPGASIYLYRFR